MVAGEVSQDGPTRIGIPATLRLVSLIVSVAVVVTALVVKLTVPVAVPSWIISVVAVTGTRPSSLNDPVAGGSVSVPVSVDVVRSAVVLSVPGPRSIVEPIALMKVLPVTGYETLTIESDGAVGAAGLASAGVAAAIPATAAAAEAASSVKRLRMMRAPSRGVHRCDAGGRLLLASTLLVRNMAGKGSNCATPPRQPALSPLARRRPAPAQPPPIHESRAAARPGVTCSSALSRFRYMSQQRSARSSAETTATRPLPHADGLRAAALPSISAPITRVPA